VPHVAQTLAFTNAYIRALWIARHAQREMPKSQTQYIKVLEILHGGSDGVQIQAQ
jgi:hypothetical protein